MMRIAILASGNGTNAQAILDKISEERLDAEVGLIISDKPGAGVLDRARRAGAECELMQPSSYADRQSYDLAIAERLIDRGCTAVVLAGWMRLLSPAFLDQFPNRVLNIHPSLLPAFPGTRGILDAYNHAVKLSGVTVHFASELLDDGPIIIQGALQVRQAESAEDLEARIHKLEHRLYPQALQWLASGRLRVENRRVLLEPCGGRLAPRDDCQLIQPPLEEGF